MRSYKIFQSSAGDTGQINLGAEFSYDGNIIARHNYSFSADDTREKIHAFLEEQLNGKIIAMEKAQALAATLAGDIEKERMVSAPVEIVFAPAAGTVVFPAKVSLTPSAPVFEIRYTLDGTEPGPASPPYRLPIVLEAPAAIRAACFTADGLRGRVQMAGYYAASTPTPQPLHKRAVLDLIPQADMAKIMANDGAYRVFQSFLILGPDVVASSQAGIDKAKGFTDQYLAALIISQATYDAIRAHVIALGWAWA